MDPQIAQMQQYCAQVEAEKEMLLMERDVLHERIKSLIEGHDGY
jgi:hypothetical protein